MEEPGKVSCLRCAYRGDRTEVRNFSCTHSAFKTTDFLGIGEHPLCSYVNASKNCNGFKPKEEEC